MRTPRTINALEALAKLVLTFPLAATFNPSSSRDRFLARKPLGLRSEQVIPDKAIWSLSHRPCSKRSSIQCTTLTSAVEGWFSDRLGCDMFEDQLAVEELMESSPKGFLIDWHCADLVSSALQQILNASKVELRQMMLAHPAALGYDEKDLKTKLAALQELLHLSESDLRKVVLAHPDVLGYSIEDNLQPLASMLQQLLNISKAELRKLVLAYPSVLGYSDSGYDAQEYLEKVSAPLKMLLTDTLQNSRSFHTINMSYPGLEYIHRSPDIFIVKDFLTNDECDRIVAKAKPNLFPCVVRNPTTGEEELDTSRTSLNAILPRLEAPSIVSKIVALANCTEEQLEVLSILFYVEGQKFLQHTDGFHGPTSNCGFFDSGRLATVFCYLNDVDRGGRTRFTEVGIDITPKKGMAVVHFPTTKELEEDLRTEHEGLPAVDQKWLLSTWVWKHCRHPEYSESMFPQLSKDVI